LWRFIAPGVPARIEFAEVAALVTARAASGRAGAEEHREQLDYQSK
jgi:hypothetical protein